jgi:hypothetical protein
MFQKEEAQWGNSTGLRGSDAHDERGRGRWDADARSWKKEMISRSAWTFGTTKTAI